MSWLNRESVLVSLACSLSLLQPASAEEDPVARFRAIVRDSGKDARQFSVEYGNQVVQDSQKALSLLEISISRKDRMRLDLLLQANAVLSLRQFLLLAGSHMENVRYDQSAHAILLNLNSGQDRVTASLKLNPEGQISDIGYGRFSMKSNMAAKLAWHLKYHGIAVTLANLESRLRKSYGSSAVDDVLQTLR